MGRFTFYINFIVFLKYGQKVKKKEL